MSHEVAIWINVGLILVTFFVNGFVTLKLIRTRDEVQALIDEYERLVGDEVEGGK